MKRKRFLDALYQSIFILLGNTVGIWLAYIFINFILTGIIPDLRWPGFLSFVTDGSLLLITFSILTTVLMSSSSNFKFNAYNIFSLILLLITILLYVRNVGLNGKEINIYSGSLPFIASSVLLFFALKDHRSLFRKHSWRYQAKGNAFCYEIFLSFAIAGNDNKSHREAVESYVDKLDKTLKQCGYTSIFNASKYFNPSHEKQQPIDAAIEDFAAIENSRNFVLFYPEKAATSALIELGYALRDKRNILIVSKNIHTLPFLARGMDKAHENVRTLFYDEFEDCLNSIKENHKTYFK